jgi:hypothetical protein
LAQRLSKIATIGATELRSALARPSPGQVIVVVGDREALLEPLRALGEVKVVDPLMAFHVITSRPALARATPTAATAATKHSR